MGVLLIEAGGVLFVLAVLVFKGGGCGIASPITRVTTIAVPRVTLTSGTLTNRTLPVQSGVELYILVTCIYGCRALDMPALLYPHREPILD